MLPFTAVHHVAIICTDLEAAKQFYVDKLSFTVLRETHRADRNDCKLDLKPEADGYSFVLTVAAKTGKYIGFDVKIDDSDGKTVKEFPLGNGKELYKNRYAEDVEEVLEELKRYIEDLDYKHATSLLEDYLKKIR